MMISEDNETNGVDERRAGDVNPLICCDCWKNPGTYVPGSPLKFLKFTPFDHRAGGNFAIEIT